MMEKEKPVIIIGSIPFVIVHSEREIRRVTRPEFNIPFSDLDNKGDYYTYQLKIKPGLYDRVDFDDITGLTIDLILPAPLIDAPDELTPELKKDLNQMSQKEGWGFFIGDVDLVIRLSGKLPQIDLNGTDFTVDWRLKQLRETELPWNQLQLETMEISDSGLEYLCFYHTETHELFEPDETLMELPEKVVVLEIPYELILDPVAAAVSCGLNATDLLNEHPFKPHLTAKVTPLAETGLPEFITKNLNRQDTRFPGNGMVPKRGR